MAKAQQRQPPRTLLDPELHKPAQDALDGPVGELGKTLGYPVLTYYIVESEYMEDQQVLHIYEHLRRIGHQEKLGLWLSSRGGHTEVPWKIVSLLREYSTWWSALIPYRAHSAATLLALGADELIMTPMSELGPIDPSRSHPLLPQVKGSDAPVTVSVQDLRHVLSFLEREIGKEKMTGEVAGSIYTKLFDHVHPLAIGALEQSWALSEHVCRQVLTTHMDPERDKVKIDAIVERLSDGYKSHSYQISRNEARQMGLPVRDATAAQADAMWAVYRVYDQGLHLDGEAEVDGRKGVLSIAGHMYSPGGLTLGMRIRFPGQPTNIGPANWVSHWTKEPV